MSYRWLIILTLSLLLLLMHSWDAEGACRRQMDEDDSSEDAIENSVQQRIAMTTVALTAAVAAVTATSSKVVEKEVTNFFKKIFGG
ncbi:hypothetical protein ACLKA6_016392 [Drosophila palustris]